jgi:pimeloyl-ACP methyl ester carboxylesterase
MPIITTKDGAAIFYKAWGTGRPVVFSHGWPLNADAWDPQLNMLAGNGYRAIAHDRRGHGRSHPDLGRQRDGHLGRRSGRAAGPARRQRRRPGRAFHWRWRGCALPGSPRPEPGRQGRPAGRGAPTHAQDRRQPERQPDRDVVAALEEADFIKLGPSALIIHRPHPGKPE